MAKRLSEANIAQRLVQWRNLKQLHAKDQQTKAKLRAEIKLLNGLVFDLRHQLVLQQQHIDKQAIRIAELEQMVFGAKKKFRKY